MKHQPGLMYRKYSTGYKLLNLNDSLSNELANYTGFRYHG